MTEQNTEQNEWAKREIGALWEKQSPTQTYFSGHFTVADEKGVEQKVKVVIFTNKHKKKDTHPDYRIYRSADPANSNYQQQQTTNQQTESTSNVVEEELI